MNTYTNLNAELNLYSPDGKLQLHKDKEAARAYFLENVNPHTMFFHDLEEKIHYMVKHDFWSQEVFDQYDPAFVKRAFKQAYGHKFRFSSFMGAYKFYTSYALRSDDGQTILERYEDRVTMTALFLARGDRKLALSIIDEIVLGRFQPATPTFQNAGKSRAGELVSCFEETALIETSKGLRPIKSIEAGDLVLTHDGSFQMVLGLKESIARDDIVTVKWTAEEGGEVRELRATPEHPILARRGAENGRVISPLRGDGDFADEKKWIAIGDLLPGDFLHLGDGYLGSVVEVGTEGLLKPTPVYNLEVEKNHTYVADGVVVHNCFLLRAGDSLDSIEDTWTASAQLSKIGGGVAIGLSNLRERGAPLKGKEGLAKGVISWMKIYENIFSTVDQLGTRPGAGAVYLSVHHPDIMDFLDCKRENADSLLRIKNLSTGVVIPDVTFELAKKGDDMYLFSPYDVQKEYGIPFDEVDITAKYDEMVNNANIRKKKVSARKLLSQIAELQFESGYPYCLFADNANNANPIEGKIVQSNLCVTGDTMLLTDNGYRRADELFETQEDFDVVSDLRARDRDLNKEGVSIEKSTKMFKTAENAEVFKMTTKEGFSLRATAYHKMFVARGGEVVEVPMGELQEGDKVLVQSGAGTFGKFHNPDLAYIHAVIAADGTIVENTTTAGRLSATARINLYDDKDVFAGKIEETVARILEDCGSLLERQSTLTPKFIEQKTGNNSTRISLHSAPLAKVLSDAGITQENKTSVPDFVRYGDEKTQKAFINGLFQMDATVTGSIKAKTLTIELGSIHFEFLQDIQMMLLNLGIYTRIYKMHDGGPALAPDGKGGQAMYDRQPMYSLRASSRGEVAKLYELVEWRAARRARYEELTANKSSTVRNPTHKYAATVVSVDFDGVEDVYDVTVENGHSIIVNSLVTHNCSEILQSASLSEYDEKTGETLEVGRDISCNLGSLNVYNAMLSEDFGHTIETSMRALTAVSDMTEIHRVPSIRKANNDMHSVGLGQMSLATYFATHGMVYGDEESLDFTNMYFMLVNYWTLVASNKIAKERKASFYGFERSTYATGEYWEPILNEFDLTPRTKKVAKLFADAKIELPTREDWELLRDKVQKTGLWHSYRQAVAPTGSISYITSSSPSILPVTSVIEIRKEGGVGRVYVPAPHLSDENREFYKDAFEVGPHAIIDVYAEATRWVDQGLSCTLHMMEGDTTRELTKAQLYAWKKGLKTLYYVRVRAVASGQLAELNMSECVSCAV